MLMIVHPRPAKRQPFNYAPPNSIENTKKNVIFLDQKMTFNYAHPRPPAGEATSLLLCRHKLIWGNILFKLHYPQTCSDFENSIAKAHPGASQTFTNLKRVQP